MPKAINSFNIKDRVLVKGKLMCYYDIAPKDKFEVDFDDITCEVLEVKGKDNKYFYKITDAYGLKEIKDYTLYADHIPESYLRHKDCRRLYDSGDQVLVNGNLFFNKGSEDGPKDRTRFINELFKVSKIIPDINGNHKYNLYKESLKQEDMFLMEIKESYLTRCDHNAV